MTSYPRTRLERGLGGRPRVSELRVALSGPFPELLCAGPSWWLQASPSHLLQGVVTSLDSTASNAVMPHSGSWSLKLPLPAAPPAAPPGHRFPGACPTGSPSPVRGCLREETSACSHLSCARAPLARWSPAPGTTIPRASSGKPCSLVFDMKVTQRISLHPFCK